MIFVRSTILLSMMFCVSCSIAKDGDDFAAVKELPTPTATVEKVQVTEVSPQSVPVKNPLPSFPHPEPSNLTWEDIYFEEIIKREKASKLGRLKSKSFLKDNLEVRIWSGFGLSLLKGFVLKRTAGEWTAEDLDWEVFENRKGKRVIKQVDRKLDVPKSGWDAAWQRLVDAGILTLPDAEEINCSSVSPDGTSFVVEYKLKNTYRTYLYDNPNPAKCDEAKRMLEISKIIAEEFYKREVKVND